MIQHYYANEHEDDYRGKCKCGKPGTYRPDPYELEINDQKIMKWLCDDCYREIAEDI